VWKEATISLHKKQTAVCYLQPKLFTSLLKFIVILTYCGYNEIAQRIFKCSDMQHTSLTPDEELNSFMYGTLLYVNIYASYKLWKNSLVFGTPCIFLYIISILHVRKKTSISIVRNFDEFRCIVVTFGKQHRESIAKLPIQLLFASPNQWCYFTLQNEMRAILAVTWSVIKTDQVQEDSCSL